MKVAAALALALLVSAQPMPAQQSSPIGGSACVVAKRLGDSQAIEWAVGRATVSQAIADAKRALIARGFEHVFPQGNSPIPHGWLMVVKTEYQTYTGKMRTSYGCGFSAESPTQAEALAVNDLRTYSWGWKPAHRYKQVQLEQF
jgi:hypothetical protein